MSAIISHAKNAGSYGSYGGENPVAKKGFIHDLYLQKDVRQGVVIHDLVVDRYSTPLFGNDDAAFTFLDGWGDL